MRINHLNFRFLLDKVIQMQDESPVGRPAKRAKVSVADDVAAAKPNATADGGAGDLEAAPGKPLGAATAVAAEPENPCAGFIGEGRPCRSKALADSAYCWRHSPLDPKSGMVYCSHMKKGKRCTNPILATSAEQLCKVHLRQLAQANSNPTGAAAAPAAAVVD